MNQSPSIPYSWRERTVVAKVKMRGYHLPNSQKVHLLSSKVTWLCCRTGEHRLTANVELLPAWFSQPFSSGVQLAMKALWIARFGVFVKENARVTWNTHTVRISTYFRAWRPRWRPSSECRFCFSHTYMLLFIIYIQYVKSVFFISTLFE